VAAYFFDSSALVKRYVSETGTGWVKSLLQPSAGHTLHLASITGVEVTAALTRRTRGGHLTTTELNFALSQFHADLRAYQTIGVSELLVVQAVNLARLHALRGYDAVQLAAALAVHAERRAARLPALTLVCADSELNAAARSEGLLVENPNLHP